jgi:hypothetical protein
MPALARLSDNAFPSLSATQLSLRYYVMTLLPNGVWHSFSLIYPTTLSSQLQEIIRVSDSMVFSPLYHNKAPAHACTLRVGGDFIFGFA